MSKSTRRPYFWAMWPSMSWAGARDSAIHDGYDGRGERRADCGLPGGAGADFEVLTKAPLKSRGAAALTGIRKQMRLYALDG